MTVAELIELLKTKDQGAIVEVIKGVRSMAWEGDSYSRVDFDPLEHMEYIDLRGNPLMKTQDANFEKRFLLLGEAE